MKKFLLIAALVALTAPDATACLAGRARARSVSRTKTVQQTCVQQAPAVTVMVPQVRTVEKTVYEQKTILVPQVVTVPKKVLTTETVLAPAPVAVAPPVVVAAPAVTKSKVRSREVVRGVVAAPVRIVGAVLPCPNCK